MSCYDEVRPNPNVPLDASDHKFGAGPRVVRDEMNVREIAANTPDFVGHSRPRLHRQRDADWRDGE